MTALTDRELMEAMVLDSLVHFHSWTNVRIGEKSLKWEGGNIRLLSGTPPHRLSNDDNDTIALGSSSGNVDSTTTTDSAIEYILPVSMTQYKNEHITLECMDLIFERLCDAKTKRLVLAIINDDGTIVFYFIYKGIHKPRKN